MISDVGNSGGLAHASDLTFEGGAHLSRAAYSTDGGSAKGWVDEFERDANIIVLGTSCPPSRTQTFSPLPTPLPLDKEWRAEP